MIVMGNEVAGTVIFADQVAQPDRVNYIAGCYAVLGGGDAVAERVVGVLRCVGGRGDREELVIIAVSVRGFVCGRDCADKVAILVERVSGIAGLCDWFKLLTVYAVLVPFSMVCTRLPRGS